MKIVFIANQFIGDQISSGGDVLFTEVLKRTQYSRVVLTPAHIHPAILEIAPTVGIVDTDIKMSKIIKTASTFWGGVMTVYTYILRSFVTYVWLRKNLDEHDMIYLTGDFICNTLPVWLLQLHKIKPRLCANFYHLVPGFRKGSPKIHTMSSKFIQYISLSMMRAISDKVFVLSEIGQSALIKRGFLPSKIDISGAGIDPKISAFRTERKIKNQFVYIGRLNLTKGVFDLIEILNQLNSALPEFFCYVIGQGSDLDMQNMCKLIKKNGLEKKVKLTGFISETEKMGILSTSAILLSPSKEEGYGIAIHEALYLGLEVVCYELPVLKVLFGKSKHIHFVPMNNLLKFSEKIYDVYRLSSESAALGVEDLYLQTWDDVYLIQSKTFDSFSRMVKSSLDLRSDFS